MPQRRWFRGKSRVLEGVSIREVLAAGRARVLLVEARYRDLEPELYVVPVDLAAGERAEELRWSAPAALIAELETQDGGMGLLYDATASADFAEHLLAMVLERRSLRGKHGRVRTRTTRALRELVDRSLTAHAGHERRRTELPPQLGTAEQSNTNLVYGERLVIKIFRVLEEGAHPEEEVGRYLTEHARFTHVPRLAASLTYEPQRGSARAFAVAQQFVPSQGDAWVTTVDAVDRYFQAVWEHMDFSARERQVVAGPAGRARASAHRARHHRGLPRARAPARAAHRGAAPRARAADRSPGLPPRAVLAPAPAVAVSVGARPARPDVHGPPAPDRRARPRRARARLAAPRSTRRARREAAAHPRRKIEAVRTRTHGDFHLGQVLVAGGDFVFIDFEGEPARPLAERRRKRSPVRDVAGLLRSFDYAAGAALRSDRVRAEDAARLAPWARAWAAWVGAAALAAWREEAAGAPFLPTHRTSFAVLLDFHLLEKCIYELRYELDNRPDWIAIPLSGLVDLLDAEPT
ncbi:MAG: hypothetical protein M5U28_26335 [Sandaracinaceae bacterium]|nr:hypothetical protein [Sandaracinaceae bacterium]